MGKYCAKVSLQHKKVSSAFYIRSMQRNYRVYSYTNIITNQKYVGTTHLFQSNRAGKNGSKYIKMCRRFGEAILEYGWPNFKYEILENGLTKEEASLKEKEWIEKENTLWPNGYNLEAGGKEGHSVHDDSKKKMIKARGYVVEQYSMKGNLLSSFISIREASRKTGVNHTSIARCVNGCQKTAGGFVWKFLSTDK